MSDDINEIEILAAERQPLIDSSIAVIEAIFDTVNMQLDYAGDGYTNHGKLNLRPLIYSPAKFEDIKVLDRYEAEQIDSRFRLLAQFFTHGVEDTQSERDIRNQLVNLHRTKTAEFNAIVDRLFTAIAPLQLYVSFGKDFPITQNNELALTVQRVNKGTTATHFFSNLITNKLKDSTGSLLTNREPVLIGFTSFNIPRKPGFLQQCVATYAFKPRYIRPEQN